MAGLRVVAKAAREVGAKTLVHVSAIGADKTVGDARTKAAGEAAVLKEFPVGEHELLELLNGWVKVREGGDRGGGRPAHNIASEHRIRPHRTGRRTLYRHQNLLIIEREI